MEEDIEGVAGDVFEEGEEIRFGGVGQEGVVDNWMFLLVWLVWYGMVEVMDI